LNLGTNLRDIDKTRDIEGIILPNKYTNLSEFITSLKHENQQTTVANIQDAAMPYAIDSSVNGFPVFKYVIIVAPSWLNAGFISAVISMLGKRKIKLNFTAFLPFKIVEYINAHTIEIVRHIGCMKTIENANINPKYRKFTRG